MRAGVWVSSSGRRCVTLEGVQGRNADHSAKRNLLASSVQCTVVCSSWSLRSPDRNTSNIRLLADSINVIRSFFCFGTYEWMVHRMSVSVSVSVSFLLLLFFVFSQRFFPLRLPCHPNLCVFSLIPSPFPFFGSLPNLRLKSLLWCVFAQLADFGLSVTFADEDDVFRDDVGSIYYVAPEVLGRSYTKVCRTGGISGTPKRDV